MKLSEIAQALELSSPQEVEITGISTDSRTIKPGNLFVAIRGPQFDGHHFISQAAASGASAVLASKAPASLNIPHLIVMDTILALAKIAKYHRQSLNCGTIALTGSNGKTSVKEMISSILPQPSHATPGNLNNHIGAPLSVLQLNSNHRYAVFELGANHPGDISYTVQIVKPQVALVNNIAPAHIAGFGSIEGVADTKGEIYRGLEPLGFAIVNDDDHFAHYWDEILKDKQVIRFSASKKADIYAANILFDENNCASFDLITPKGQTEIRMHVPGMHTVRNALAAASCTYALGIGLSAIAQGLTAFHGVSGRLTFFPGTNNSTIIDDTYNANLRSVLTALDILAQCKGKRIFIFGDMGELGEWTTLHHQEVGAAARELGIECVFTYGTHSKATAETFGPNAQHFTNQEDLLQKVLPVIESKSTILVKGSRSAKMEKIVAQLKDELQEAANI
jgi:UDP-N-acetylmuramoyl-tripeptide--D-alanyl-D-alanine ligase